MAIEQHTAKVTSIQELTQDVRVISFKPDKPMEFTAGQFIITILKDEIGKEVRRSYSIASAPNQKGTFDLCVKILPNGAGSKIFDKYKINDPLKFEGPMGRFVIDDLEKDHVFIASGVGVAPIRGQIHYLFNNNFKKQATLFFSCRHETDFYFKDEFDQLLKHDNFKLIHSVSRPTEQWHGETGRVNIIVEKYLENANNKIAYACGPPLMIKDIVPILRDKGFERSKIKLDIWEA